MNTKQKLITSLKIWIVIYPSITLFLYLFSHAIAGFPLYIRTLILTAVLVPWMIFLGLPLVHILIKFFSNKIKGHQTSHHS